MLSKTHFNLGFLFAFVGILTLLAGPVHSVCGQSTVVVQQQDGQYQLLLNGQPYRINGVGGETYFAELAALGGNSVRTWGADRLGEILDSAHAHGLTVCAGIWMGHQRHGFNYQDATLVEKQLQDALAVVAKYKDHPALLMWAVGNEAEGEGNDPSVWYAINHVAREVKRLDPNHPTMTVIAELGESGRKVQRVETFCPDIDILGVNSYGGIESIPERYRQAGGVKPYIITEHGPLGPWEVGKTTWGAPIEATSSEKAILYAKGHRANVVDNGAVCLGSYAFLWGHKQETTATWFGMILPDGSRLAAADAMSEAWTGTTPKNRCPQILKLVLSENKTWLPGESVTAQIEAIDPEGQALKVQWVLRADSVEIGEGGDPQKDEATIADALTATGNNAKVTFPPGKRNYRLFAYVSDDQGGAAVANAPLSVGGTTELAVEMPASKLPYSVYAEGGNESVFIPSGYMGNTTAIAMTPDSQENPHSGKSCLKVEYRNNGAWGGVLWQSPAEDWEGTKPGGANLTGAKRLEFWARGAEGGEEVNFVFGVLDGNHPYPDTAKGELSKVQLTKEWRKYSIALDGLDLRQIKTGFGWSLAGQGKPITFYLDDIAYTQE